MSRKPAESSPDAILSSPLNNTRVPDEFSGHPFVKDRFFYTLPQALLDLIVNGVGLAHGVRANRFDSQLLQLERTLGRINDNHTARVGFHRGCPMHFHLLHRIPIRLSPEEARFVGIDPDAPDFADRLNLMNQRTEAPATQARAYLCWLLTNRDFLAERDSFFKKCSRQIAEQGLPVGIEESPPDKIIQQRRHIESPRHWVTKFRSLCRKWKLSTFAGPLLPIPFQVQIPVVLPGNAAAAVGNGRPMFCVPEIASIGGSGELNELVDEITQHDGDAADHLAGWVEIVKRTNTARNTISTYARRFEYQHLIRVLYSRHCKSLQRSTERVRQAAAHYLDVDDEVLRKDEQWFRDTMGKEWRSAHLPF